MSTWSQKEQMLANYTEAVQEAERFIDKANEAISRIQREESSYFYASKETAAAKRASMDLTNALVTLRKTARC